ncbi:DUF2937 family protein [Ferrigenium sp. UT5]|uniref:DUF2937 family protein n=1 Tax=Ferrigenium sp. UT5 TaxID=3242105 RepID=UPI003550AB61
MGALAAEPDRAALNITMRNILHRYLLVIVACVALLAGLQIPNLVDQYEKRVDAHLREVTANLQPFQEISNKYFGGDLNGLLALHRNSDQASFREEGAALEKMMQRKLRFTQERAALQVSLPLKALHVIFHADQEMMDEVLGQYSYAVPLDRDALTFGAGSALAMLLLVELALALARTVLARIVGTGSAAAKAP